MRGASSSASTSQSPALLARIEEKKQELENLKDLRDLSAAVANQMEALETKLGTLSDGTEGMDAIEELIRTLGTNQRHSNCGGNGKLAQRVASHQYGIM